PSSSGVRRRGPRAAGCRTGRARCRGTRRRATLCETPRRPRRASRCRRDARIHDRAEAAVTRGGEKARNETLDLRCGSFRLHEDDRLLRRRVRRRAGCGGGRSAAEGRGGRGDGGEAAQDLHGVKVYACLPYPPVMETAAAPLDLLVVGAGPVGLACALEAARQGLSHVVIEKGALLDTLVNWPTHTIFFSTPELLEIGGHPFVTASGKPTRREGLVYYRKVAEREGLAIRLHERVLSAERDGGLFRVSTTSGVETARAVVVATGFYANPNLLGVPGENLPKVSHYYTEPFAHALTEVLVVGGKNSAVEAALDLHRNGVRVTMAVRKSAFGASVKYWLRPDIENRVKEGSIRAHFETTVAWIEERRVVLETAGKTFGIPNDFV